MKQLRFLTGAHAGALISLPPGMHRIGVSEACDICVSDWQGRECTLEVDQAHAVWLHAHDNAPPTPLTDYQAFAHGGVTLCTGGVSTWPNDMDLLADLLNRIAGTGNSRFARVKAARRGGLPAAGIAMSALVSVALVAGLVMFGTQASDATIPGKTHEAQAALLSARLHERGLQELDAVVAGNSVIVSGMVRSAAEDFAARRVIAEAHGVQAARGYDVVDDDVRSMQESLAPTGAHVSYAGHGAFRVSGTVASLASFKEALANLRADFDVNVRHIESDVKENPSPIAATDYTEMVSIGEVRYIETPDGVKHVYPDVRHDIN